MKIFKILLSFILCISIMPLFYGCCNEKNANIDNNANYPTTDQIPIYGSEVPLYHEDFVIDNDRYPVIKNKYRPVITGLTDKGKQKSSLTIPEGIYRIDDEAFLDETMISVSLPSTLVSIGSHAFARCNNLETVTIASDSALARISSYAFAYDGKLKAFTIPSTVIYIGNACFDKTFAMTELTFEKTTGWKAYKPNKSTGLLDYVKDVFPADMTLSEIKNSIYSYDWKNES